jgi:hypothetical protein
MANTPSWLTDDAIARHYELGRAMESFLLRHHRRKRTDPDAKVDIGRRLRKLLARLETEYGRNERQGSCG